MAASNFYQDFLRSDLTLDELAAQKGIKCTTASSYVYRSYNPRDAPRILEKLGIDASTVCNAYKVMVMTQEYRQQYPSVTAAQLTPYIHEALGEKCSSHCLATAIIRRLFMDVCKK